MSALAAAVALAHLRGRQRQSAVSVLGVAVGVGVYIGITGMMQGFHAYFLRQLVESNPHVTITDEVRHPAPQPMQALLPGAAVQVRRVLPRDPVRGLAGAGRILAALDDMPGVAAAPTLSGQLILRRAGRDYSVGALGIDPVRQARVTNLAGDMVAGGLDALAREPGGIIIGASLAARMGVALGDRVLAASSAGNEIGLRIVGIFRTGLEEQDLNRVYITLARQQSIQGRPRVVNQIGVRLADIARSRSLAARIEGRWGYKAAPWEETYSRFLDVLTLQNWIMFSTTGAILVVAGFGIFNVISTVVLEKARDIAIMRSIGLPAGVVERIFLLEGAMVGVLGMACGVAAGRLLSDLLGLVPAPGAADPSARLIVSQDAWIYLSGAGIALASSVLAAWIPARRAAALDPLDIIRGAT